MARRTFTSTQIADILDRWHQGASTTSVAEAVGVDRKTVKKYTDCAVAAGIRQGGAPLSLSDWSSLIARQQRDVVKMLCLNDKLSQIDVAGRSADERKTG